MTDAETLQAFLDQQQKPPAGQADQTGAPPPSAPPAAAPAAAPQTPFELPQVATPAPTTTPTDVAILDDYLKTQPMGQPDKTVQQKLPPFQPDTGPLDITTGVQPGPVADPFDMGKLDDFITDRAAETTRDQMQRATELMDAMHRGEWNAPPEWLHDIAQRINAQTPSLGGLAKQYGKAFLQLMGLPQEMPQTAGQWESTLLHLPENTATASVNNAMSILGMGGSALKTAGQLALENIDPTKTADVGAAETVGLTKGLASLYPLGSEIMTKVGVPLFNQMAPSLGMAPQDRVDWIENTARAYNQTSRLVHGEQKLLGYDPTAAPGTEATTEFAGASAPFMLLPEAAGINELFARGATRAIQPIVERAVPLAMATDVLGQQAAMRASPVLWKLGATGGAKVAEAGAKAGAGYLAGELFGGGAASHAGAAVGALSTLFNVRATMRDIVAAFKAAPDAAIADQVGTALTKSLRGARPLYSALQDGVQGEIDRLGVQSRMIRNGADDLAKTDAKMPNGDNVFTKEELKNNAITVRDNLAVQTNKLKSLQQWAKWERLVTDTVTGTIATGAATLPTGLVLGGVNALQAPPGQEQAAALQGMQTGMALDLPIAVGKVGRAFRENAVRGLQARGRANAITPDHPEYAINQDNRLQLAKTDEGRVKLDAMDQTSGLLSPLGTKIIGLTGDQFAAKEAAQAPAEPVPTAAKPPTGPPMGKPVAPNARYDPAANIIYYNIDAPLDTLGHELSHPFEQAIGENLVGNRLRAALSNPADQPRVQVFLNQYRDLMRRTNPNFAGLSPQAQISEMFAELGRDVIRETPPSALYGGRSGWQLITRTAGKIADTIRGRKELTSEIAPSPGFVGLRAPQFPGTRAAMEDLLFGLGERARYGQPYGQPAEAAGGAPPPAGGVPPPVGGGAGAGGAGPPPPPTALTPAEEQVMKNVHAGAQTIKLGTNISDVGDAIVLAKQNGVDVNESNIIKILINQVNGRDPFYGLTPAAPPVGGGAGAPPPTPPAGPPIAGQAPGAVAHPDYAAIRGQAEDAMRQKLITSKAKDVPDRIARAGIEAAAQAHAKVVGPDSDLITWRTDKFGKSSIWGKTFDPANDPFHAMILERAATHPDWSPAAARNLKDIEDNMGRTVAVDYSHAPEEGVARPEREETRRAAGAPERVAGEAAREKLTKSFVPNGIRYSPKSNVFMVDGFSPDKFLSNAIEVIDWANGEGKTTYGGVNDPLLVQHVQQLTQNHQNGFDGAGKPIKGTVMTPVEQTPGYTPHVIPRDYRDQLNVMFGNDTAKTGVKGMTPEQHEKQALAKQNSPYFDPQTGEVNKVRAQMGERAKELSPVYETLRPELIDRVRQAPVKDEETIRPTGFTGDRGQLGLRGLPRQDFTAANLMPATPTREGAAPWSPTQAEIEEGRARGRIGSGAVWDYQHTFGDVSDLAKTLGVDPKKRFAEQKPENRQKIQDYYKWTGQAQYMPATTGFDPEFKQPEPVSDDQLRAALTTNKVPFVGANRDLPAGTPVSSRIDIPSFLRSGIYAQTVHAPKIGKNLGYDSIVHMDGPITFTVRESTAERIKNKLQAKAPIAATEGKYNPDRTLPADINDLNKWTPLGFDPYEHSYFYDKTSDRPVTGASEAIHIGNTVYVKEPVYGEPAQFKYMPATPELGLYTKSSQVVQDKMPNAADSDQVKALFRNNGIGKNEMEWLGLNDLPKGKLTRDEMQQWISGHTPEISQTVLGREATGISPELRKFLDDSGTRTPSNIQDWLRLEKQLRAIPTPSTRKLAEEAYLRSREQSQAESPRYGNEQLNLPGGSNYREFLYQLPQADTSEQVAAAFGKLQGARERYRLADRTNMAAGMKLIDLKTKLQLAVTDNDPARQAELVPLVDQAAKEHDETYRNVNNMRTLRTMAERNHANALAASSAFSSSHFAGHHENLFAHMRADDRTTADGNKMLFSQEYQSDWAQALRERGLAHKVDPASLDMAESPNVWSFTDPISRESFQVSKYGAVNNETAARQVAADHFAKAGVADMPFKSEAWKKFLMRQQIRQAVEEGKDSIGWTTGDQQNERYNLSKAIHSLHYEKLDYLAGEPPEEVYKLNFRRGAHATYEPLQIGSQAAFSAKELPGVIGKELANKIVNAEGHLADAGSFSGLDLKVGGEGKKNLYDKQFVQIANNIGKPFGAKVRDAQIRTREAGDTSVSGRENPWSVTHPEGGVGEYVIENADTGERFTAPTWTDAHNMIADKLAATEGETVHELPITPEMRASVKDAGQAMWMPATPEAATAREIATEAHEGQTRRFTGEPYINHPLAVAAGVPKDLQAAAILHDVLEDTGMMRQDLIDRGISAKTADLVQELTRRPDESYADMIDRISKNPEASAVKLSDLRNNIKNLPIGDSLRKRYEQAIVKLQGSQVRFMPATPPDFAAADRDLRARGGANYPDLRLNTPISNADYQNILADKEYRKTIADTVRPLLPKEIRFRDPVQQIEAAVNFFKENKIIHHEMGSEYPWYQRATKQYEGYNIRAHDLEKEYGYPVQRIITGESGMSPQTPPDQSFDMLERLMKVARDGGDTPWDARFDKAVRDKQIPIEPWFYDLLRGKTYNDLNKLEGASPQEKAVLKAMWARTYDQAFHSPEYRVVTPEGNLGEVAKGKNGKPIDIAWRGFGQIAKGIRALEGEAPETLLPKAKISNYYNSKIAPNLAARDWVADTHDIGSSWLSPVTSDTEEVGQAFGGPANKALGHHGVSALHIEAGNRAAAELGMIPSDLQAGIWSHQQGFMSADALPPKAVDNIRKVWQDARRGKYTVQQARAEAIRIATEATGGARSPTWARESAGRVGAANATPEGAADTGQLPEVGGTKGASRSRGGGGTSSGVPEGYKTGGIVKGDQDTGVYLIRHGCTALNAQASKRSPDVIRGHEDVPLDDKGVAQAAQLGKDLGNKGIHAVYTSDLSRARDTGAPVAQANGAQMIPTYGLRPWDLGPTIQGKRADHMQPHIEHLIDHPDVPAEGGESFNQFKDRFLSTMHGIVHANRDKKIAVVTHYRGTKLLGSLDKNGEVDNEKMKSQGGALDPADHQFLPHNNNKQPVKGIKSNAV